MTIDPCHMNELIILALYAILELWLGKTQKTRAASLLELILLGVFTVGTFVYTFLRGKYGKSRDRES